MRNRTSRKPLCPLFLRDWIRFLRL